MIINHNVSAINAHRVLKFNYWDVDKHMSRLSSGMRINTSADDASGLAVSEKMRTQVQGLRQAERNTEDGLSLIQVAEGYLNEVSSLLQRVRVLAVQSANGIYTPEDREIIQVEVDQLVDEIDRLATGAEFNTKKLLNGRFSEVHEADPAMDKLRLHMGANMDQRVTLYIGTMSSQRLGVRLGKMMDSASAVSVSRPDDANNAIGIVDEALSIVSKQRADMGAYANRLVHAAKGLMVAYENIQSSESRIRDADMAEEMTNLVTRQILVQSGTSMLAQANMKPQAVLKLLQ